MRAAQCLQPVHTPAVLNAAHVYTGSSTQAMARVHRIGQTRPVHVYRLVSEGTVEDRIQARAEGKLYLDQVGGGGGGGRCWWRGGAVGSRSRRERSDEFTRMKCRGFCFHHSHGDT